MEELYGFKLPLQKDSDTICCDEEGKDIPLILVVDQESKIVASDVDEEMSSLFIAAPDLLAAAEDLVARWHAPSWKEPAGRLISRLERAIAKARGAE